MRAEIVTIGTELLLGDVVDSNSSFIAGALNDAGIDVLYATKVGDNLPRMVEVLRIALDRADAVICTGGIGPTPDDITREAIVEATGRPMRRDEAWVDELHRRFSGMGREMPANNARQGDYPDGATLVPNPKGTAPALIVPAGPPGAEESKVIYAVPGVPAEMRPLVLEAIVPDIARRAGRVEVIVSRTLRTWGMSESGLAEEIADIVDAQVNPTIAFLATDGEIKLRLTAKASTPAEAFALIAPEEARLRERVGAYVFGADGETLEAVLGDLLRQRGCLLAAAESATGGRIAARITEVAGSSDYFAGGVVAYTRSAKEELLAVPAATIDEHGIVSEATALAMARGIARLFNADVAIATTGAAGPAGHDGVEPGTVCFAVCTPDGEWSRTLRFPGDRERVRVYATTTALQFARLALLGDAGEVTIFTSRRR